MEAEYDPRDYSRVFAQTYNAVIAAIFLLFTFVHFYDIRVKAKQNLVEKKPLLRYGKAMAPNLMTVVYRKIRAVLLYQPPGKYLESSGTILVIASYLGLNCLYCFYRKLQQLYLHHERVN